MCPHSYDIISVQLSTCNTQEKKRGNETIWHVSENKHLKISSNKMKHKTFLPLYVWLCDIKYFHASSVYAFSHNDTHTSTNIATFYEAFETLYDEIWTEFLIKK